VTLQFLAVWSAILATAWLLVFLEPVHRLERSDLGEFRRFVIVCAIVLNAVKFMSM